MRPVSVTLSASGASQWAPVNCYSEGPIGLYFDITSGATLTSKVQLTADDLIDDKYCAIAQSGTTATLVLFDHGLSVGDSVVVMGAHPADLDGERTVVSVVSVNIVTYTATNSATRAVEARAIPLRVFDHASMSAMTAKTQGSQATPVTGIRLNNTAYTDGTATLRIIQPRTD